MKLFARLAFVLVFALALCAALAETSDPIPPFLNYYEETSVSALQALLDGMNAAGYEALPEDEDDPWRVSVMEAVAALTYNTAEVPQVYVVTEGGRGNSLTKPDGYIGASISIVDTDGTVLSDAESRIKVRGNSTARGPKMPFNIKLSQKQDVLGMGKAKKWALLANCYDPTMLRNAIAFDLAQHLGLAYTSQYRFVELWMDGVYKGLYQLTESVEAGSERVDIDVDKGEFLLEYELSRLEADKTYFKVNDFRFSLSEPETPTPAQLKQIQNVMSHFTYDLKARNFKKLREEIDVQSFVNYYILAEMLKPADLGYSSVYLYYKDGKLYAGPIWDYDLSSGNLNQNRNSNYAKTSFTTGLMSETIFLSRIYYYLYCCRDFRLAVAQTFKDNAEYLAGIYAPGGRIDTLVAALQGPIQRNFSLGGWDPSVAYYAACMRAPEATYEGNVEFLRSWLDKRHQWLTKTWKHIQ